VMPAAWFTGGQHLVATVTATDLVDEAEARLELVVVNSPPTLEGLAFRPAEPIDGEILWLEYRVDDVDDDQELEPRITWWVDGQELDEEGDGLSSSFFDRGDLVEVQVWVSDGHDLGGPWSLEATVQNAPPSMVASLVPSPPLSSTPVRAEVVADDADGDDVTVEVTWTLDGVPVEDAGLDGLEGGLLTSGAVVEATVTASDGSDVTEKVLEATVVNAPPTLGTATIEPSEPRQDRDDLVCVLDSAPVDPDGEEVELAFTWPTEDGDYTDGHTTSYPGDTIPRTWTTEGQTWGCLVTASDGENLIWVESDPVIIQPSPYLDLAAADLNIDGSERDQQAGTSLDFLPDLDGDGLDELVVGVPQAGAGEVAVFAGRALGGSESGTLADRTWSIEGDGDAAKVGTTVAAAGDLDGDGLADLLIGDPDYEVDRRQVGAAMVVAGSELSASGTVATTSAVLLSGEGSFDDLGSVVMVGDLSGDGTPDAIVAAPRYDFSAGAVAVWWGGAPQSATVSEADLRVASSERHSGSAGALALGDLDGDGLAELVVAASSDSTAYERAGKVSWIDGATTAAGGDIALEDAAGAVTGGASNQYLGSAVATGDVDGDGHADLLVGARGMDVPDSYAGGVVVLLGSSLAGGEIGVDDADATVEGRDRSDYCGSTLAVATDLDGDGGQELLVGCYGGGGVYLALSGSLTGGTSSLSDAEAGWRSSESYSHAGTSLAFGGDFNGDGEADLVIGDPYADDGGTSSGRASLVLGPLY